MLGILVVVLFVSACLYFGIKWGKGIKTLEQYALGGREFSNFTLTATIVATWTSGSGFVIAFDEMYKGGLIFAAAGSIGVAMCLVITAKLIGPRVKKFLGCLSVADVMGNLYGGEARFITAICSVAKAFCSVGAQIKVLSMVLSSAFEIDIKALVIISSAVIITYSALGGVRSVTFTDVVQFFTFGISIPLLLCHIIGEHEGGFVSVFTNKKFFSLEEIFDKKNYYLLFILLYYCIPGFNPSMVQRILIAKNIEQAKYVFKKAGQISMVLNLFMVLIAAFVLSGIEQIKVGAFIYFLVNYLEDLLQW